MLTETWVEGKSVKEKDAQPTDGPVYVVDFWCLA